MADLLGHKYFSHSFDCNLKHNILKKKWNSKGDIAGGLHLYDIYFSFKSCFCGFITVIHLFSSRSKK